MVWFCFFMGINGKRILWRFVCLHAASDAVGYDDRINIHALSKMGSHTRTHATDTLVRRKLAWGSSKVFLYSPADDFFSSEGWRYWVKINGSCCICVLEATAVTKKFLHSVVFLCFPLGNITHSSCGASKKNCSIPIDISHWRVLVCMIDICAPKDTIYYSTTILSQERHIYLPRFGGNGTRNSNHS